MDQRHTAPEFARPVALPQMTGEQAVYGIAAGVAERAGLAARFELLGLDRLEAEVSLERLAGGLVRLAAAMSAEVVQACVVTLEPVPSHIEERFTVLYGAVDEGRVVNLAAETDSVEPLLGGTIDIGEAVAQQLSLALEPSPRAPDVPALFESAPEEGAESPFAALKDWGKAARSRG